ncbi:MAG TPA: hypothetical protein HA289_02115 [Ferroplasma sp.]|nr:hypothetical protein [Ferroplasma sp.]
MKNKMPMKYRIILVILSLPLMIMPLVSLLTPYNLLINPLFENGMLFSICAFMCVDIYGMYVASKLNKKRGITK